MVITMQMFFSIYFDVRQNFFEENEDVSLDVWFLLYRLG